MSYSAPDIIEWPLAIFMTIVVAGRYRRCNANLFSFYYNNFLASMLLAVLLRIPNVEDVLSKSAFIAPATAQQLSLVSAIIGCTELIGFNFLWSQLPLNDVRYRMRRYRVAAAILSLAFLSAGSHARIAGKTLEQAGGWDEVVAWGCYLTMVFIMCGKLFKLCVSELKKTALAAHEFVTLVGMLIASGSVIVVGTQWFVLPLFDRLGWTDTADYRLMTNRIICFFIPVVVSALGAIPLGILVLTKFGLDSTSRTWKKLQPVRASLTAAVPSSIFYTDVVDGGGPRNNMLQLQHTVIELRDAIWRLQPYCPNIAPDDLREFLESYSVPPREHTAAISALRVSRAVKAKTVGATPASTEAEKEPPPRATTLDEEIANLLGLAKWWELACAANDTKESLPI
ncbi:DUF6545 domain-containing protein [Mycobacterium attenuatum]|uniref:DUF6545 domain-containing protein n=1 Tax=Mycobacterium attenuatum TaxID=2341086 RepID=UPI000F1E465A|nr:DUF6545 domain-containing protein [Mycobacterium attenuatum]VBA62334.1 hypothetical protein LAUMK41_05725 [Mycobacterium attenuatum]